MESKLIEEDGLLPFTDLDFGIGRYVGARIDWSPHTPCVDPQIIAESLKELGDLATALPQERIVSAEVFNRFGCAYRTKKGKRCGRKWKQHKSKFTLLVKLNKNCYKEELVSVWEEAGHIRFVQDFDTMEMEGEYTLVSEEEGLNEEEEGA